MLSLSTVSQKFKQSPIRAMSKICYEIDGINLGQGICDLATPQPLKDAACQAINKDFNKYAPCEGILPLRQSLAAKIEDFNKIKVDPNNEIMIGHGSTGAFVCAIATLFNPQDEVLLFAPFYGYHKSILDFFSIKCDAVDVSLEDYSIDFAAFERKIKNQNIKGLIICSPCNPSGKVFTEEELIRIGNLCKEKGIWIITDEIYEYITYPKQKHISIASLRDYFSNTITISGFSKTYNMTGWRLGYALGPKNVIEKMALCHDLFYVCPPTPLQYGVIQAPFFAADYYDALRNDFLQKRDLVLTSLQNIGFTCPNPQGAYYILANYEKSKRKVDDFSMFLLKEAKVATVPGSAFYIDPERGKNLIRLCFAVDMAILRKAMHNLQVLLG